MREVYHYNTKGTERRTTIRPRMVKAGKKFRICRRIVCQEDISPKAMTTGPGPAIIACGHGNRSAGNPGPGGEGP